MPVWRRSSQASGRRFRRVPESTLLGCTRCCGRLWQGPAQALLVNGAIGAGIFRRPGSGRFAKRPGCEGRLLPPTQSNQMPTLPSSLGGTRLAAHVDPHSRAVCCGRGQRGAARRVSRAVRGRLVPRRFPNPKPSVPGWKGVGRYPVCFEHVLSGSVPARQSLGLPSPWGLLATCAGTHLGRTGVLPVRRPSLSALLLVEGW